MIIHLVGINTPAEYALAVADCSVIRPANCPTCGANRPMWIHGSYWRTVVEDSISNRIKLFRFKCSVSSCASVGTCLPPFLIPHHLYATTVIAAAVEGYALTPSSYLEQAEAVSSIDSTVPTKPSATQVFRWVDCFTSRIESLLFSIQREIIMRLGIVDFGSFTASGANSSAASKSGKKALLDKYSEFLFLARMLVGCEDDLLIKVRDYFLHRAESVTDLFSRRLPTPHRMQSALF